MCGQEAAESLEATHSSEAFQCARYSGVEVEVEVGGGVNEEADQQGDHVPVLIEQAEVSQKKKLPKLNGCKFFAVDCFSTRSESFRTVEASKPDESRMTKSGMILHPAQLEGSTARLNSVCTGDVTR